jgi:hypothetical protein
MAADMGTDDAIPTLEHNDRIPVLTDLPWLESDGETVSVDPDLFLGGSAPCLRFPRWFTFHFRDYRNLFRRPLTILISPFRIYFSRGDRWSRAYPGCEELALDFEPPEFLTV